jgi:uncharacterized protein
MNDDATSALTRRLLTELSTITVVGCSSDPRKAAYSVPAAMQAAGWRIIPVNPHADEVLGERVYRHLADVPEPVGLVDVFRPSAEAAEVTRQAIEAGAAAIWLQLGIVSQEARLLAEQAGIPYVEDRCLAVERARHGLVQR